jgi:hypothetical protein
MSLQFYTLEPGMGGIWLIPNVSQVMVLFFECKVLDFFFNGASLFNN